MTESNTEFQPVNQDSRRSSDVEGQMRGDKENGFQRYNRQNQQKYQNQCKRTCCCCLGILGGIVVFVLLLKVASRNVRP